MMDEMMADVQNRQLQLLWRLVLLHQAPDHFRSTCTCYNNTIIGENKIHTRPYHFYKESFLIFLSQTPQLCSKRLPAYETAIAHQTGGTV